MQGFAPFLYVASTFENSDVVLDGNYFFGNKFKACNIYLNNIVPFGLTRTNSIENCRLYLGKKVDREAPEYKELLLRFKPSSVYYEK